MDSTYPPSVRQPSALVTGAGGFIGAHLVERLVSEGYRVRGVDRRRPQFSPSVAQQFLELDLRSEKACQQALWKNDGPFDECYQLSALMGGMGFISKEECAIGHDSVLINTHMVHTAVESGVGRYFLSSSACVYHDQCEGDRELAERDVWPAQPDNLYGLEKLYSEEVLQAYGRKYPMAVRIGRFQNTYGPFSSWKGGKEKAPAAMCRKVAECPDGGTIEIWGDGTAIRAYTYISDLVDGVRLLMRTGGKGVHVTEKGCVEMEQPFNIGRREYVTVDQLADIVIATSGKKIAKRHIAGPVGVQNRGFRVDRAAILGWESKVSLEEGIRVTYPWVLGKVLESKFDET